MCQCGTPSRSRSFSKWDALLTCPGQQIRPGMAFGLSRVHRNVLVIEDNEPAAKWLSLINQALNKWQAADAAPSPCTPSEYSFISQASSMKSLVSSRDTKSLSSLLFFPKPSLKTVSKNFRMERWRRLRTCNCPSDVGKKYKDSCFSCQQAYGREDSSSSEDEEFSNNFMVADKSAASSTNLSGYSFIASKQMWVIFVSIWVRKELVQHIGHLRLSSPFLWLMVILYCIILQCFSLHTLTINILVHTITSPF